jgi:multicomponent Na+:H+ antiporter subunit E
MFLWNLLLAIAWMALTGSFSPFSMLVGFSLGYLILWLLATRGVIEYSNYIHRFKRSLEFIVFFISELIAANLRLTREVLRPVYRLKPGIVAIPLEVTTDAEITFLANLLSLTPGSLSLDVSTDGRVLYVHALYVDVGRIEQMRGHLKKDFERRVMELLR